MVYKFAYKSIKLSWVIFNYIFSINWFSYYKNIYFIIPVGKFTTDVGLFFYHFSDDNFRSVFEISSWIEFNIL